MVEFSEPVLGRIAVQSGDARGAGKLERGHVETSRDGRMWTRRKSFRHDTGRAEFLVQEKIRFLRVVYDGGTPAVVAVREVVVLQ